MSHRIHGAQTAVQTTSNLDPLQCERTRHSVTQFGLKENRLLNNNPKVRDKLIHLIDRYQSVFTDGEVAVGKTDDLRIKNVLIDDAVPVHTPHS